MVTREMEETAQISMNVQALKQTNVILTLFVTTLSDPTSVAALLDIRVMVETAQPLFLAVLQLVVQTQVA